MTRDQRNNISQLEDEYFNWLCGIVSRRGSDVEMSDFCRTLHEKYFYGGVPNDDNRKEDGFRLRALFMSDNISSQYYLNGPCSVFELMVGLAERMEFILSDLNASRRQTAKWFWVLVNNLGLEPFTPNDPEKERKKNLNDLILTKMMERTYGPDGRGGLFPLRRPRQDQRKIEIWYQMQSWIEENS